MVLHIEIGVSLLLFFGFLGMLLQVLLQICLLGVRFAAQITNVGLQVFRIFVFWYVLEQSHLVGETLVARVAFEGFVRLMATRMGLQIRELGKGLRTAGMTTLVRLVSRMCAYVLLQM